MKPIFTLLLLMGVYLSSFAQYEEYDWDTITFESEYQYILIDTSVQNIWEIGEPDKPFFDTAFSPVKAILTDTSENYPVNNHSYFDLYLGDHNIEWFDFNIFIEIKHKFDTDTLRDGGSIEVSYDMGENWMNIINDSSYMFCETPNQMNMFVENLYSETDTLFNGEFGFSGNSGDWMTTRFSWFQWPVKNHRYFGDTLLIRFNFYSDDIENNREGWMIDNIRLYSKDVGSGSEIETHKEFSVYPNPTKSSLAIEFTESYKDLKLEIVNLQGQLVKDYSSEEASLIQLDLSDLKKGVYFMRVNNDGQCMGTEKIMIR
jgi:hypothetical protein